MNINKTTEISKTDWIHLTDVDIISLLKMKGIIDDKDNIAGFSVFFTVPGGGDWSNENCDIDKEHPVTVVIEYKKDVETGAYGNDYKSRGSK